MVNSGENRWCWPFLHISHLVQLSIHLFSASFVCFCFCFNWKLTPGVCSGLNLFLVEKFLNQLNFYFPFCLIIIIHEDKKKSNWNWFKKIINQEKLNRNMYRYHFCGICFSVNVCLMNLFAISWWITYMQFNYLTDQEPAFEFRVTLMGPQNRKI